MTAVLTAARRDSGDRRAPPVFYSPARMPPPSPSRTGSFLRALIAVTALATMGCHASTPVATPATAGSSTGEERIVFCSEVSSTNMRWTCWGEITPEIAARRARTIRVTFRGERRVSAEVVNGRGAIIHGDAGKYVYEHDEQGRPIGETISDALGVVREKRRYPADGSRTARLDPRGEPAIGRVDDEDWTVERHELDAQGRRLRTLYVDETGAPRSRDGRERRSLRRLSRRLAPHGRDELRRRRAPHGGPSRRPPDHPGDVQLGCDGGTDLRARWDASASPGSVLWIGAGLLIERWRSFRECFVALQELTASTVETLRAEIGYRPPQP